MPNLEIQVGKINESFLVEGADLEKIVNYTQAEYSEIYNVVTKAWFVKMGEEKYLN